MAGGWILLTFVVYLSAYAEANQNASQAVISWDSSLKMEPTESKNLTFKLSSAVDCEFMIDLSVSHNHSLSHLIPIDFNRTVLFPKHTTKVDVLVKGEHVGQTTITISKSNSSKCDAVQAPDPIKSRTTVYVVHSYAIIVVSEVIGWIYFFAWSVSFYPQVFLNFRRKSVVGLNFDFLALNITGFLAYAIYNVSLFWVSAIQTEYFKNHPDGVNPVQTNDVVFAVHAFALTLITIIQAAIYEKAGQKVSRTAFAILSVISVGLFITLFVAVGGKITWLVYINILSYVKLGITLIKYMPQVLMNYRRKSTIGWSIGNVLLDFTGGAFSILQMILQSYNNDEWDLIFGDPTKFGLGLFSIFFDLIFIVQHYILYNPSRRKSIDSEPLIDDNDEP